MGHYYLQVILPENTPDTEDSKLLAMESLMRPHREETWDYYRIGGRWDGAILGKTEIAGCYNEGKQHECLDNNCTTTDDLIEQVNF